MATTSLFIRVSERFPALLLSFGIGLLTFPTSSSGFGATLLKYREQVPGARPYSLPRKVELERVSNKDRKMSDALILRARREETSIVEAREVYRKAAI
jgi:hypothetical protein